MVILELGDRCGGPVTGVAIETAPIAVTGYFTADRLHVDPASGTTAASAVLTGAARYCSPLCLDITCSCADATCGPKSDHGGQVNGFHVVKMRCDPP